ncbi:MAG: 3-phosphoshikimate 1-carboxyvinyltransferase [Chloroflexi bacterium]|nr:3-phosphoshikimate 1-carboxyvinyltransferase [Ardenticatenaceae bacterium]MBL1129958.1 3-phosphoshikimate 1-carboxyvinyltransferase [Chloroflexota bacterium]NOG36044.1 3-phosphoshikimate 1-carboxyvinyltransferase [Chloroflexota bacterium]GIK56493.1 MAG: 3-phosphoshikimate 1-carboxyvinyltransferase [Chloroflexota bacterium]
MSTKLLIHPQTTPLRGIITVPGDKSVSHRAVMLAAIAEGVSVIRRWLPAGDTLATLGAVRALGVEIEIDKKSPTAWDLQIEGRGLHGLQPPDRPLDLRNAGTGIRLLAGLMAGQRFPVTLDGSEQLRKRPMRRIAEPLRLMGARIETTDGRAPLHLTPAPLHAIQYEMPVASAQVKSAVLLAGLYAAGETAVYQPGPARDHTERMLAAMGANVETNGNWITMHSLFTAHRSLQPLNLTVPSDMSSAAFPLVAAAIVPHSQITIENVGMNETRTGILDWLRAMGANFTLTNERVTGGEPVADLTVRFDELHSTAVHGASVVCGIDELPIWAVAASQAAGSSTVRDAAELRVKEVDRIGVLAGELRKLGIQLTEYADGFTVHGPVRLALNSLKGPCGVEVDSHDDHRLGMSLAVAGLVATGDTLVHDAACVADSFPGFVETMQALGANMQWVE